MSVQSSDGNYRVSFAALPESYCPESGPENAPLVRGKKIKRIALYTLLQLSCVATTASCWATLGSDWCSLKNRFKLFGIWSPAVISTIALMNCIKPENLGVNIMFGVAGVGGIAIGVFTAGC